MLPKIAGVNFCLRRLPVFLSILCTSLCATEGLILSFGTLRSSLVAAPNESTLLAPISISVRYFTGVTDYFYFVGGDAAIARNRVADNEFYTLYRYAGYLGGSVGTGYWLFGSDDGTRAGFYLAIKPYFYYQQYSTILKSSAVVASDASLSWALTFTYMGGLQFAFNKTLSAFIEGGYGGVPHAALGLSYWTYWSER